MFDHLRRDQLIIVQDMLFDNAKAAGIPISPIHHKGWCTPCLFCCGDGERCFDVEFLAATPCDWCGQPIYFELDGIGHCKCSECQRVRDFYALPDEHFGAKRFAKLTKEYSKRRRDVVEFFGGESCRRFRQLSFEELKFGMTLEIKTIINGAIKQLRGITNGAA